MSLRVPRNSQKTQKRLLAMNRAGQDRKIFDEDPWRVFRIMSEFVDGFEMMSHVGLGVTVFGSARAVPGDFYYEKTREIAFRLARKGHTIITGGGPGIMEAANRGAGEAGGISVGLNIQLPTEQVINPYVNVPIGFRYFFIRKVMFIKYATAAIIMPGGMGTMDEVFEVLTLIQTEKIRPFPILLVGKEYWQGLSDWIHATMLKSGMVSKHELLIYKIMDDPAEIVKEIQKCTRSKKKKMNF